MALERVFRGHTCHAATPPSNHKQSQATTSNHTPPEAIGSHRKPSEAIRSNRKQSEAIITCSAATPSSSRGVKSESLFLSLRSLRCAGLPLVIAREEVLRVLRLLRVVADDTSERAVSLALGRAGVVSVGSGSSEPPTGTAPGAALGAAAAASEKGGGVGASWAAGAAAGGGTISPSAGGEGVTRRGGRASRVLFTCSTRGDQVEIIGDNRR